MTPLRLAHARFNPSDILALTSGVAKVAIRLAFIVTSVLSTLWYSRIGLFGANNFWRRFSFSSTEWIGLPIFLAIIAALYSGSAHLALIFSRTSGLFAGLASPINLAFTSGSFILDTSFALVSGFFIGLFSFILLLVADFPNSVIPVEPSPPGRKFVRGPFPSWILPYFSIKLRSNSCAFSMESTI